MRKPKGIFCLEGDWWNNLKAPASVEPILDLLGRDPYRVPYIHKDVATREALDVYLAKWTQARYADHPILYLAFHGSDGNVCIGDMRRQENRVSVDDLEAALKGRCRRRFLFFSCCAIMARNGNRLNKFLRETGALAICGYTKDVDWLQSAAFELLVFGAMQENAATRAGAMAIKRRVNTYAGKLVKSLGFRMVVRR